MLKVRDYKCNNCSQVREYFVADHIDPTCKFCDSNNMVKIVTAPALLKTNFADKPSHRSK